MLTGQNYPAWNSYAIPTDYSVLAAASKKTKKEQGRIETSATAPSLSDSDEFSTLLRNELIQDLARLKDWAVENSKKVETVPALSSVDKGSLLAVYRLLIRKYDEDIQLLSAMTSPLQYVELVFDFHAQACNSIRRYLRRNKIKGLTPKALPLW